MHKETKWAGNIIAMQEEDGKWGGFHSLSRFYDSTITTEQALRRLQILGYTIEDDCIRKAVDYMEDCLAGKKQLPDRREKCLDWDIFTSMILSAWIREYTGGSTAANAVAAKWAEVIAGAFAGGYYEHERYVKAYSEVFKIRPNGGRLVDFVSFYPLSLLRDSLDEQTESAYLDYILEHRDGIYYIYGSRPDIPPAVFESKEASHYLGAIELLARYKTGRDKLQFVAEWLFKNRGANGMRDMGRSVLDRVYFPLSDNWRKQETREADCTERMTKLLCQLGKLDEKRTGSVDWKRRIWLSANRKCTGNSRGIRT